MIAIAYYLLKVLICSSVLFLYYHVALRNKLFHQWNRYFLLLTVICSLLIPCFEFELFTSHKSAEPIQLLQVVYSADEYVIEASSKSYFSLSAEQSAYLVYLLISIGFLVVFILSLYKIYRLVRLHKVQAVQSIKFVNTDVQGTPFSFLNIIFWNRKIDIHSPTGQQIFEHELVHVKEKHTLDKIFLQIVLSLFWWNPTFWLIRRELAMIHEFIADKKSVGQADAAAFAAMILHATYPQHSFNKITNQFFQSSIKRRLSMLTKQKKRRLNYASRILALPLIALLVFAFTVKTKAPQATGSIALDKEITVVIDAGHGGNTGARVGNLYEDDLVLQLAKAIKAANNNNKINIVFTRESENNIDLKERVAIAERNKADLFISLHMNAADETSKTESGIEVLVPSKNSSYQKQSELLGSALLGELKTVYPSASEYSLGKTQIWVVDKNICPAVLIECGYLTDEKDRAFMTQPSNQKLIARQILVAIERYAASGNTGVTEKTNFQSSSTETFTTIRDTQDPKKDTTDNPIIYIDGVKKGRLKELGGLDKLTNVNEIKTMSVYKGKHAIDKYGEEGADGVIELFTKLAPPPPPPPAVKAKEAAVPVDAPITLEADTIKIRGADTNSDKEALVIIDGKEKGKLKNVEIEKEIKPNVIKEISVHKGKTAMDIYGDKGKHGVIEITTKKAVPPPPTPTAGITIKSTGDGNPLIFIDGKERGKLKDGIMKELSPDTIESMTVLKGESAEKLYGKKGKDGVIVITTKEASQATKVEKIIKPVE